MMPPADRSNQGLFNLMTAEMCDNEMESSSKLWVEIWGVRKLNMNYHDWLLIEFIHQLLKNIV